MEKIRHEIREQCRVGTHRLFPLQRQELALMTVGSGKAIWICRFFNDRNEQLQPIAVTDNFYIVHVSSGRALTKIEIIDLEAEAQEMIDIRVDTMHRLVMDVIQEGNGAAEKLTWNVLMNEPSLPYPVQIDRPGTHFPPSIEVIVWFSEEEL